MNTISYMKLIPIKKSRKIPVLQTVEATALTNYADEVLLSKANVISEGAVCEEEGNNEYSGSTYVSIDLADPLFRGLETAESRRVLCEALQSSLSFRIRLMRLARIEAERRVEPLLLTTIHTELVFNIESNLLLVDIEVESSLTHAQTDGMGVGDGIV